MRVFRLILLIMSLAFMLAGFLIFLFTGGRHHNVLPLISLGEKYLGEAQFEDAELEFTRAINIDPRAARAYYGQARANIGLGNNDKAVELLNTVAALSPDKQEKVDWMIKKINDGSGNDIILLPFRTEAASDEEFENLEITSDDREIVVALDKSGSMEGTPIEATRTAAKRFTHEILSQYADLGVVAFSNGAEILSDFTMDESAINEALDGLHAGGGTETGAGLELAYKMINASGARNKIIVLMSDGKAGDDPLPIAQQIKDSGITIYTLGFFGNETDKSYVQSVMQGIASNGCHYEVDSESSLKDFFSDIASQINGQKYYYIRLACPVDVTVEYDGEKLESKGVAASQRTSFGTLTFEESDENDPVDDIPSNEMENRIKVLRLKEGKDYEISILGNGKGKMNYTIGFMDDDGDYSDIREFKSIPITKKTAIYTEAKDASSTTLEVDSDGDGKIDTRYVAGVNGKGEKVDFSNYIKLTALVFVSLILLIVILVLISKIKSGKAGHEKI